jgi:hypothetical protein
VIDLNVDGVGFSPPTDDFAAFPVAGTAILPTLERIAGRLGMVFDPQPWHEGMNFSFDTQDFLERGVVGVTVWQGSAVREPYRGSPRLGGPIHTPNDEYSTAWPDAGIDQHLALYRGILEYYVDGGTVEGFADPNPFESIRRVLGPG